MDSNNLPPNVQLMNFITGKWISKPIYVAAELGIADMISNGSKSIDELAQLSNSHAPSLYRMMRALACVGIFKEIEEKQFALTPMGELLKKGDMRSIAILFNSDWSDKAWGFFKETIKTGSTAFERAFGKSVTEWIEKNPDAAEVFNEANAVKAASFSGAIIDAYDFSDILTLTDVGGGLGILLAEILESNPTMKGILADIPSVVCKAEELLKSRNLGSRCKTVDCDFFESIPFGTDAYLMSNILHDWTDEKCIKILSNCHKAMKRESRLLITEMLIQPGNQASLAKMLDLEMMVTTGGRERTESEFRRLLDKSGFTVSNIISTSSEISIIECSIS